MDCQHGIGAEPAATEGMGPDVPELIPARMLNEYVYCPRLAYLEWVDGEFEHSADTIGGAFAHRRVNEPSSDRGTGSDDSDDESGAERTLHTRSVMLSGKNLGVVAKIDILEVEGANATPVGYKRGCKPDVPGGVWDSDPLSTFGNVQVTSQALRELMSRGVPVCYYSHGGWFYGMSIGNTHKNVGLRIQQYRAAQDPAISLALARGFVSAKIRNARTLLRRNHPSPPQRALRDLAVLRRPPKDPVNALLSFAYALLVKDLTVATVAAGFDPFLGFYHRPRYGRPALALDLAEEFRPIIADSVVLTVVNGGEVKDSDFVRTAGAVALTQRGRRQFLNAYERRMRTLITHPLFGYSISYRRVLAVQVRLLGRYLQGEIRGYPAFFTR